MFSSLSFTQSLTKQDIEKSLDHMRKSGMFTPQQIAAAERQLLGMSDAQLNAIVQKGIAEANDPEIQKQAQKVAEQMKQEQSGN